MTDKVLDWHNENVANFRVSSNGNRNNNLNKYAMASYQLALAGTGKLSISNVESDYTSVAIALGLEKNEVAETLRSALEGAKNNPRDISNNTNLHQSDTSKDDLVLAPVYSAFDDYAKDHGVNVEVFKNAGWEFTEYQGRKCLSVSHEDNVKRARFLDGEKPKWKPMAASGVSPCLYGLERAVSIAAKDKLKYLVMCNGQPSVVVAQHYKIPAFCQTDGEGKPIAPKLLRRILDVLKDNDLQLILAFDGDEAGRDATKNKTEQLQANGITPLAAMFGGDDHFDLADYCKLHTNTAMDRLVKLAQYSRRNIEKIVCGHDMAVEFKRMMNFPTSHLPTGELIVTPMKALHKLGGMALMLQPGMMTEIIAPSGGGKTSFMETWVDAFRRDGYHVLWYSPEWLPMTMHLRTIQRYGGAYADELWSNVLWYKEHSEGIPEAKRKGKMLSVISTAGKKSLEINDIVAKWPGDIHCFQGRAVTESILDDMTNRLQFLRRIGVKVGVAFFDYAQLLHTVTEEKGRNSYEIIVSQIKQWCMRYHIHAVIGSQVTKEKATACIEHKRWLTKYDSAWVAPNEFGLILTLNIVYDGKDDITGEYLKTNKAVVNVAKNSTGQEGIVKMYTDFPHLCWKDETWLSV